MIEQSEDSVIYNALDTDCCPDDEEGIAEQVVYSLLSGECDTPSPDSWNMFPGMPNLGNTCYMNAVLQCVFHCSEVRKFLGQVSLISVFLRILDVCFVHPTQVH